jgi:hypothetical protein
MPRYVILLHECPPSFARRTHYDLMLASGGSLRTWALPGVPQAGETIEAESLAEHRLAYLEYEGPLSGDRGAVTRYDRGIFEWLRDAEDIVEVRLTGKRLQGVLRLAREAADFQRWRAEFEPD